MKYIVLEVTDVASKAGEEDMVRDIPFVFPNLLVHAEVAEYMTRMLRREKLDGRSRHIKPVSAGFMSSMAIGATTVDVCHGESESLKLKSRPKEDSQLIHMFDYVHGIK